MTDFTYGPIADTDELDAVGDVLCRSFNFPEDGWARWRDRVGHETFRCVRRDGLAVGGLSVLDFGQWFGGRCVPMGGIGAVGISPDERGSGAAAALMAGTVRELRESGVPLSVLYASTQTLYRTAGYERAGSYLRLGCRASSLRPGSRKLPAWEVDPQGLREMEETQQAFARVHDGNLRRTKSMWEWVADDKDSRPYAYAFGPEEKPEGYILFRQPKAKKNYDLFVRDLVALTGRAYERIWTFLADHRSLAQKITWPSWPGDPSLMLPHEETWEPEYEMVWMLRINDVPAALSARGYDPGLTEELHLEVQDEVVPENESRSVLRVADGGGSAEPGGDGRLRLHVRHLASIYTGFHRASHLRGLGLLEGDDESITTADRVFAGPHPWMPDTF